MTSGDKMRTLPPESLDVDEIDRHWMRQALDQAELAALQEEVPVGAVLVESNCIIGAGYNSSIASHDTSAHAEIQAIRQASQLKSNYRLPGTTLYVTIEPCTMCVGALIHARVGRLVFGAREPRAGAVVSQLQLLNVENFNHQVVFSEGILAEECAGLIQDFFKSRRATGSKSK